MACAVAERWREAPHLQLRDGSPGPPQAAREHEGQGLRNQPPSVVRGRRYIPEPARRRHDRHERRDTAPRTRERRDAANAETRRSPPEPPPGNEQAAWTRHTSPKARRRGGATHRGAMPRRRGAARGTLGPRGNRDDRVVGRPTGRWRNGPSPSARNAWPSTRPARGRARGRASPGRSAAGP